MNLAEWFDSSSNVVHIPTQLHVLLTKEGVRQCKSVPYLEEFVVVNEDGTGYIHSTIDKGEINFIIPLFYRLGKDAKVLEPKELIDGLRIRAKEILHMYEDEKGARCSGFLVSLLLLTNINPPTMFRIHIFSVASPSVIESIKKIESSLSSSTK